MTSQREDQERPAVKIKFALQHDLPARKKIIGASDIFKIMR